MPPVLTPHRNDLPALQRVGMWRVTAALCLLLMLPACSALKLGYNNAPGLVSWWLDGYFNFTTAQKDLLRPQLEALHAWHRQQELPAYIALLDEMQTLAAGITPEGVCAIGSEMFTRIEALNLQFEPIVAALAPTLSADQLKHLQQGFDDSNEEWREEWMDGSAQERRDHRLKQAVKRAEEFYGDLTTEQVAIIRVHIAGSSFDPAVSYAERLRRQQDALETLSVLRQGKLPPTSAMSKIHQFFLRMADSPDAAYRSYLTVVIEQSCTTIADLHNSTTTEQRAQAAEKLQNYQADLRLLHQQRRHDTQ